MRIDYKVIKYVPDTFRFEPTNVGIVVFSGDTAVLRFLGETKAGRVDGRRARGLRIDADNYGRWIRYFRKKASSGQWDDVRTAFRRRPDFPFYVDDGGTLPEEPDSSLEECVTMLYGQLVEAEEVAQPLAAADRAEPLSARVSRIIEMADIPVERNVKIPAFFGAGPGSRGEVRTQITFPYALQNGHLHLMEPVAQPTSAYAFFARAEAAYRADHQLRFLAFYRGTAFDGHEHDLEVIESYANAVDVDEPKLEVVASQLRAVVQEGS